MVCIPCFHIFELGKCAICLFEEISFYHVLREGVVPVQCRCMTSLDDLVCIHFITRSVW